MEETEVEIRLMRRRINVIDRRIAELLVELGQLIKDRFGLAGRIGEYKKMRGLPFTDPERERIVIQRAETRVREIVDENNLATSVVRSIFQMLIAAATALQQELHGNDGAARHDE